MTRWSDIRSAVIRVLRRDLRVLRARMEGLGLAHGRLDANQQRLLIKLESAAHHTRLALATAEAA